MRNGLIKGAALGAALLVGVAACEDTGTSLGEQDARLTILLTDAPADYVAAARVDIGAIQLVPGEGDGENDGGIITLTDDGTDGYIDLLDLQGEATAQLAELEIESGTYSQIRLIVDSAEVELIEGYEFNDGGTTQKLFVPSGAQTGIKLNLQGSNGEGHGTEGGVEITPGETVLVLDFDVNQSFRMQGNAESPAGIRGFIFRPTIRVVVNDVAGSISGQLTAADDSIDVTGLTVTATPTDEGTLEEYQSQTGTAVTDSLGAYTIYFLVPGGYDVTVEVPEGFETDPANEPVTVGEAEDVTGIDFTVDEPAEAS